MYVCTYTWNEISGLMSWLGLTELCMYESKSTCYFHSKMHLQFWTSSRSTFPHPAEKFQPNSNSRSCHTAGRTPLAGRPGSRMESASNKWSSSTSSAGRKPPGKTAWKSRHRQCTCHWGAAETVIEWKIVFSVSTVYTKVVYDVWWVLVDVLNVYVR